MSIKKIKIFYTLYAEVVSGDPIRVFKSNQIVKALLKQLLTLLLIVSNAPKYFDTNETTLLK